MTIGGRTGPTAGDQTSRTQLPAGDGWAIRAMEALPMAVVYPDNLAALGVCRALGVQGIPVTVLSSDRTAPGQYSRYAHRIPCPSNLTETELADFLIELGRAQERPSVLFLTDDASILATHRHRARLEEWYRFVFSPWPVTEQILFKDRLYRALEGVVPVPRTGVPAGENELAALAREIGYPLLVKPPLRCVSDSPGANGLPFEKCFGAKAIRVRNPRELTDAYRAARSRGFTVLLQEEIEGTISSLYSLGLYATRDGAVVAAFTSKKLCQVPADFGDGLIVQATRAPELIPLGERVIRHLGYYGMADIEFKWDARARTYKLLDFNPRPWFWINLATACGVNLPYAAYLDAPSLSIHRAAFRQRDFQTRWVSARGLLVYLIRSKRPFRGVLTLLRHLPGRRVGPLWCTEDFLFRMFLSPKYWRETLRQAARALRRPRWRQRGASGKGERC